MKAKVYERNMNEMEKMFCRFYMDDTDRDFLGQSMFYYCCGKDPSPIVAFREDIPLYIYADIVNYGLGDFAEETEALYEKLKGHHFVLQEMRNLRCTGKLEHAKQAVLTCWKGVSQNPFYLLYVQCDAKKAFEGIYRDDYYRDYNYIQPKYICNYSYEMEQENVSFFNVIEKRVQYIMGHCHNDKYRRIGEFDYLGDAVAIKSEVKLYHRFFYYVY